MAERPHLQPPSHPQLPHHTVGAVRDSDHPEPLEGPSRSSGTLTPPLPAVLAVPRTPTVLPAKAGIQGRVAGHPHLQPPSHYQLPRCIGTLTPPPRLELAGPRTPPSYRRKPVSRGAWRGVPTTYPHRIPNSPAAAGPSPLCHHHHIAGPHTPTVLPAKAGIQGRG